MAYKKLMVEFPGRNYSTDKPLLYYAGKVFEEKGYEVIRLGYNFKLLGDKDDIEGLIEEAKSYKKLLDRGYLTQEEFDSSIILLLRYLLCFYINENKYKILKENNHNLINVRSINRSFSGRNLSKSKRSYIIPKNKSNITFVKKSSKKKNDFCENKGNNYEINNKHRNILNNSDNNLTSNLNQWNEKKPKQLKLIYSHPNLNNYKIEKNSYGINLLNSSPNSDIINNTQRNKNIKLNGNNMNVKNLHLNKLYNINNNDINNRYNNRTQNKMNIQNSINGINKYIVSANSNVNKSQLNIDFMNLFPNGNLTNGFSHSFNYVNGINSEINNSINGNEILNIYNKFPKNNGENNFKSKNFQNLFYNLNPINNSNIIFNNFRNNNKDIIINDPYSNNKYSEYYNIINNNNINNNGNFINKFQNNNNNTNQKNQNHNKKINQNNNQNYNHNGNSNYINGNGNMNNSINTHNEKDINNNNEFSDQQIDYLFSQLYSLPKEVCILLYIINKKGVNFFINLTKTIKGSKYLQNTLQSNPPKEMEVVCITKIICVNYKEIMCDHYGNYFLQKFFPFCNHHQRIEILISIKNDFINIANHICGNHSLQCLISLQNTNEEKEIIRTYTENNLCQSILFPAEADLSGHTDGAISIVYPEAITGRFMHPKGGRYPEHSHSPALTFPSGSVSSVKLCARRENSFRLWLLSAPSNTTLRLSFSVSRAKNLFLNSCSFMDSINDDNKFFLLSFGAFLSLPKT